MVAVPLIGKGEFSKDGSSWEKDHDLTYRRVVLKGKEKYRLMYGFASQSGTSESDLRSDEEASVDELTKASKVVFSSTLQPPLP